VICTSSHPTRADDVLAQTLIIIEGTNTEIPEKVPPTEEGSAIEVISGVLRLGMPLFGLAVHMLPKVYFW